MAIFKRIEVWVLLVLSLAAVWYVMKMDSGSSRETPVPDPVPAVAAPALPKGPASDGRFKVQAVRVIPEEEHEIIEIELAGKNENDQPLDLDKSKARLVAGDGSEIPPFFVPFAAPPILPAGEESTMTLRYWQTGSEGEVRPPLTLEIDGESLRLAWRDGRYEPKK